MEETQVYKSSGNVFADLGFKNADEMLAKAELIRQVNIIINQRSLTEMQIAELLDIELS